MYVQEKKEYLYDLVLFMVSGTGLEFLESFLEVSREIVYKPDHASSLKSISINSLA